MEILKKCCEFIDWLAVDLSRDTSGDPNNNFILESRSEEKLLNACHQRWELISVR